MSPEISAILWNVIIKRRSELAKEDIISTGHVTIQGKKYAHKDLSQEQIYFLRQIQSCQTKLNNLNFELDQIRAAMSAFNQRLMDSLNAKPSKKMG